MRSSTPSPSASTITVEQVTTANERIAFNVPRELREPRRSLIAHTSRPHAPLRAREKRKAMAVYTEVTDDDLSRLIESYGLGALLSYKGIAEGVENTNYVVHTTTGTYILTLYERASNPADLPFFMGLLEHLNQRGISCPLPVRNRQGEVLTEISGRTAALVTFLEGVLAAPPPTGPLRGPRSRAGGAAYRRQGLPGQASQRARP